MYKITIIYSFLTPSGQQKTTVDDPLTPTYKFLFFTSLSAKTD